MNKLLNLYFLIAMVSINAQVTYIQGGGTFDDWAHLKKYEKISRKFNVPMGYHQVKIDHTQLKKIINKKYEYVCFGTDLEFLNHIFKETFKKIKK